MQLSFYDASIKCYEQMHLLVTLDAGIIERELHGMSLLH